MRARRKRARSKRTQRRGRVPPVTYAKRVLSEAHGLVAQASLEARRRILAVELVKESIGREISHLHPGRRNPVDGTVMHEGGFFGHAWTIIEGRLAVAYCALEHVLWVCVLQPDQTVRL